MPTSSTPTTDVLAQLRASVAAQRETLARTEALLPLIAEQLAAKAFLVAMAGVLGADDTDE